MKNNDKFLYLSRNIQKNVNKLSDLEQISRLMEQDILNYKTMFEENNKTVLTMAETVEDHISILNERLEEIDAEGMQGRCFNIKLWHFIYSCCEISED